MLKTLLRKQITEVFKGFFYDSKNNKPRTRSQVISKFVLYIILMVFVVGGMFAMLCVGMCAPLEEVGMGWMYFAIMGGIAILLGVFGSVFSTYSGLYQAKDNDLLLSMPIPIKYIITSRLLNVYILGVMYSIIVILPAIIVYWIFGYATFSSVIGGIALLIVISMFVMALSCLLGYVVAKISSRLKNKSYITVIISLAGIAAYYFLYFRAQEFINSIIDTAAFNGEEIKEKAYVLYLFGDMARGNWLSMLIFIVGVGVILFAVWKLLKGSFLKIATDSGISVEKSSSKEVKKSDKRRSVSKTLLSKEMARFFGSANYMLNCGLGIIFMVALGILALVKGGTIMASIPDDFLGGYRGAKAVIAFGIIGLCSSMIDMAVPSVSLEGRSIWILQSMPVSSKEIMKAKLKLQIIFSCGAALFASICTAIILKESVINTIMFIIASVSLGLLFSIFNMYLGARMPMMNWTNEVIPIKQSVGALIAIFGGMIITVLLALPYIFLGMFVPVGLYFVIVEIIMIVVGLILYMWIMNKGAAKFETL